MVKHLTGIALFLAVAASSAAGEQVPKRGTDDARVLFVDYAPNNVALVVGALRQSTVVEFAIDEKITVVTVGNQNAWIVQPKGNLLFLKARLAHPRTSAHVVTERRDGVQRLYQIDLAVLDTVNKGLPPMLTVKYRYPADDVLKRKAEGERSTAAERTQVVSRKLAAADVSGQLSYAYSVQGETSFEPAEVYDNGKQTVFEFAGNVEMPAIYLADDTGKEELVAKTVEGRRVTVHALGPKFVLRRGDDVMCVFNERYDAVGIDHGTRTVSPSVIRTLKTPGKVEAPPLAPLAGVKAAQWSPAVAPAAVIKPATTSPAGVAKALRDQQSIEVPAGMEKPKRNGS